MDDDLNFLKQYKELKEISALIDETKKRRGCRSELHGRNKCEALCIG